MTLIFWLEAYVTKVTIAISEKSNLTSLEDH